MSSSMRVLRVVGGPGLPGATRLHCGYDCARHAMFAIGDGDRPHTRACHYTSGLAYETGPMTADRPRGSGTRTTYQPCGPGTSMTGCIPACHRSIAMPNQLAVLIKTMPPSAFTPSMHWSCVGLGAMTMSWLRRLRSSSCSSAVYRSRRAYAAPWRAMVQRWVFSRIKPMHDELKR